MGAMAATQAAGKGLSMALGQIGLAPPKSASLPKPPPMPTLDDAKIREENLSTLRRRRGRASTMLADPAGPQQTATKTLLGQ